MLVRGGVEDDRRVVALEHLAPQHPAVLDVQQLRHGGGEAALDDELPFDVVERAFGPIEQHEPRRIELVQLSRQLRADRSARAGDEDRSTGEEGAQATFVDDHRVSSQQVGDFDLTDRRGAQSSRDEFVERGDCACLQPEPRRVLHGPAYDPAGRGRDGDE